MPRAPVHSPFDTAKIIPFPRFFIIPSKSSVPAQPDGCWCYSHLTLSGICFSCSRNHMPVGRSRSPPRKPRMIHHIPSSPSSSIHKKSSEGNCVRYEEEFGGELASIWNSGFSTCCGFGC
ncbi:hypothetical protein Droror1_Dr00022313 [Drosera rotundifolia]